MLLQFDARSVQPATGAFAFFPLADYPVEVIKAEGAAVKGSTDKGMLVLTLKTLQQIGTVPAGTEHDLRLNIFHDNEATVRMAYATLSAVMHVTGRIVIADTAQLIGAQFLARIGPQIKDGVPSDKYSEVKLVMDFHGNTADKVGQPTQAAAPVQQPAQQSFVAAAPVQQPAAPTEPWKGQQALPPAAPSYVNGGALPAASGAAPWLK